MSVSPRSEKGALCPDVTIKTPAQSNARKRDVIVRCHFHHLLRVKKRIIIAQASDDSCKTTGRFWFHCVFSYARTLPFVDFRRLGPASIRSIGSSCHAPASSRGP